MIASSGSLLPDERRQCSGEVCSVGGPAPCAVLVRGLSEIASAVAHRLFVAGYRVALHNGPAAPKTHRRLMSFADAYFDETSVLDDVAACRVGASTLWASGAPAFVPVFVNDLPACLDEIDWDVLVDARLRKRVAPGSHRGLARLSIGVGPGHVAGESADIAIESSWGDQLGAVIRRGPTLPLAGEPRAIEGVGRERNVYASEAGVLQSERHIGDFVRQGAVVASLDGRPIRAPICGTLRGLVRPGVAVSLGDKIVEVDPRPPHKAGFQGLGERPRRVAIGVLSAIVEWQAGSAARSSA